MLKFRLFVSRTAHATFSVKSLHISMSKKIDKLYEQCIKLQVQNNKLRADVEKLQADVKKITMDNNKLKGRIDALELGHIAHLLRIEIIKKVFSDRKDLPIKFINDINKFASNSGTLQMEDEPTRLKKYIAKHGNFVMTKDEVAKWQTFISKLQDENISVTQLDSDIKILINIRNSETHPQSLTLKDLKSVTTYFSGSLY